MNVEVSCSFCGRSMSVDNGRTFRKVVGWEHPRKSGGTNHLALRQATDEFACSECLDKLKRGISPAQEALL